MLNKKVTTSVVFGFLMLLLFSCNQGKNPRQKPGNETPSNTDGIVITVTGDAGVEIKDGGKVNAKKGNKWSQLKSEVEKKFTEKKDFTVDSFHIKDSAGDVIADDKVFNENTTVFVKTRAKTTDDITITVTGDAGVEIKDGGKVNAKKGNKWSQLKSEVEKKFTEKDGFTVDSFHIKDSAGDVIADDTVFNQDTTVFIKTRQNQSPNVLITVKGDEGVQLKDEEKITLPKGSTWKGEVRDKVFEKFTVKDNFVLKSFEMSHKNGVEVTDSTVFNADETIWVRTVAKESDDIVITIQASDGVTVKGEPKVYAKKNDTWKEKKVKDKVLEKITLPDNFKIESFHLDAEGGSAIQDSTTFTEDKVVFVKARQINDIVITVTGDAGVNIKEGGIVNAKEGDTWQDQVKAKVLEKFDLKDNFLLDSFHFDNDGGELIADDKVFTENKTVFVKTTQKQSDDIIITITGDDGVIIKDGGTVNAKKGDTWSNKVKAEVLKKITYNKIEHPDHTENFILKTFHLTDVNGATINDDQAFNENTTIFVETEKDKWILVKFPKLKTYIENTAKAAETNYIHVTELDQSKLKDNKYRGSELHQSLGGKNGKKKVALKFDDTIEGATSMEGTLRELQGLVHVENIPNGITTIKKCFWKCANLVNSPTMLPDTLTDMESAFEGCKKMTNAPIIPKNVTTMQLSFADCIALQVPPVLPTASGSQLRNMRSAFKRAGITEMPEIPEGVEDMSYTFTQCYALTETKKIPASVTNIESIFAALDVKNPMNITTVILDCPCPTEDGKLDKAFANCPQLESTSGSIKVKSDQLDKYKEKAVQMGVIPDSFFAQ